MTKRIRLILCSVMVTLAVSGCGLYGTKAAAAKAQTALTEAIEHAKSLPDPWLAVAYLQEAEQTNLRIDDLCSFGECEVVPAKATSVAMRVQYLGASIKAKNPAAIDFLYTVQDLPDEYRPLYIDSIPLFLNYVESNSSLPNARAIVYAAAEVAGNGRWSIRDTSRAVRLYARAWALGEPEAAIAAARLFYSINDLPNAYLWSLRCTGGCLRDDWLSLFKLEKGLTKELARQVQKASASASVVELERLGG